MSKYRVFSGPYFPVFGLNTERYSVFLRIQSECRKIRTRKNSVFGHFSGGFYAIRFMKGMIRMIRNEMLRNITLAIFLHEVNERYFFLFIKEETLI